MDQPKRPSEIAGHRADVHMYLMLVFSSAAMIFPLVFYLNDGPAIDGARTSGNPWMVLAVVIATHAHQIGVEAFIAGMAVYQSRKQTLFELIQLDRLAEDQHQDEVSGANVVTPEPAIDKPSFSHSIPPDSFSITKVEQSQTEASALLQELRGDPQANSIIGGLNATPIQPPSAPTKIGQPSRVDRRGPEKESTRRPKAEAKSSSPVTTSTG